MDLDNGRQKSVRSYARIWRWSRGKVERFLKSALHDTFLERATDEATRDEPEGGEGDSDDGGGFEAGFLGSLAPRDGGAVAARQ